MKKVIGVDLGGTFIKAGLVEFSGKLIRQAEVKTLVKEGPEKVIERVKAIVHELWLLAGGKIEAIGIGSPGPLDYFSGIILNPPNLPGWSNVPLRQIIRTHAHKRVFLDNDTNVALLGEVWLGVAQRKRKVIMLTLGTGIGGAILIDGQIYRGKNGGAGEIGHLIIDPLGPQCTCGQKGCLEVYSSGWAIQQKAKTDPKTVFDSIKNNDHYQVIVNRAALGLAQALISLENIFEPELIILGGKIAFAKDYLNLIQEKIGEISPRSVNLVRSSLGDWAGVLGAGKLALDQLEEI
jgi:glucokinase